SFLARRPRLYHFAMRFVAAALSALSLGRGAFSYLPLAGGWTKHRELAAPQGRTFQQLWTEQQKGIAPDV
ncbi:lactate utilization protein LutB domain-containing protein, partial [Enterococcus lactis]|uniref:lactate utilisation protein LutB domain-containing protein n=1 Tax=Enterococcus lactis TaxID=357441 RepID=UPI003908258C